ncbi:4-hydroxy-tetrahydrodipicolinate synthase [Solemya elarraichensis gill symbiont]|uniref:4-hydroxy-tetrahydrodipicolinate synthase n=1 Tax=Solemya elarraichensis gill symbiont TaxID=1918949 RepID=A0A1T2LBS6_9GAMM|nr:4-hydroxy-tetrahydrodipicolinate synthase [Solemya elarraichensis gill symbiont]OOZ42396.1 4-hydroxy-tetrahydrodipicolinate synthase [Solemya elarraichensis gill symbiont]
MITGSLVALVTPMLDNGDVDYDALEKLVEWHIAEGTDGIVAVGTTGESATLNEKEHCDVIRATVETVNKRIPVIAGTGANSTSEAITLTTCAKSAGADACLLVTPYYNKPTQQGLYLHYKAVAEAVDIPQILYNVPGRTAVDMDVETVGRLSAVSNITGLKEAAADGPSRVASLRELCGSDFALYSGNDDTGREFVLNGGNGVISVTANIAPGIMHRMITAALAGSPESGELDAQLAPLHDKLFVESNPIPAKWALARMGRIGLGIRLPLTVLDDSCHAEVESALRESGVLN